MESKEIFTAYVVFLRGLALIHQNNHWQEGGQNFYANHLLFQRLYEETFDLLDAAAERSVGTFGSDSLNLSRQAKVLSNLLLKYSNEESSTLDSSLLACKDFLRLAKNAYDTLKGSGTLSLGIDDLIMSQSSTVESHLYLLQQASAASK